MALGREELRARLLATFRGEAEDLLAEIGANLRGLEQPASEAGKQTLLEATFRAVHTLKGAARSVNLEEIEAICQAGETVLSKLNRGQVQLQPGMLVQLREAMQGIARLLADGPYAVDWQDLADRLNGVQFDDGPVAPPAHQARPADATPAQPTPPPAPASPAPPAPPPATAGPPGAVTPPDAASPAATGPPRVNPVAAGAAGESIRIEAAQFDRLIMQSEELLVPKLAAVERWREARELLPLLSQCRALIKAARHGGAVSATAAVLNHLSDTIDQSERLAGRMLAGLARNSRTLGGAVDAIAEEMRRVRMTPAATVLDLLPDMAHDLAAATGKEVKCTVAGGDLQIDRVVLQAIKDPLIHLVRNAIDHGIEPAEQRRNRGKQMPASVHIAVRAREGARVAIVVRDDGDGIGLDAVKAAAVRRRIATGEAVDQMPDAEALRLVFRSSLSTRPVVSQLSGHGLGLAIVAERVERLNGTITIENQPGEGTAFHIDLPASVATFQGLLVRVGQQSFLVPLEAVAAVVRLKPGRIATAAGRPVAEIAGRPTPCANMAEILEIGGSGNPDAGTFVVVAAGGETAAFHVDEVLGDREVLLKPLQPPLMRLRNIAAAGLLATGELALVLRPDDLLRALRRAGRPRPARLSAPTPRRRQTILVVDDSLTTRTMEKNLLEAMGYRVHIAADGVDAWNVLAEQTVDLVVSDVDMPRMNGFELTGRIRADQRFADLPVILVSALETREDKEQGIRVGANAYVIKSSLEDTNLQEMIERLL